MIPVYESAAARDSWLTAPNVGDSAILKDTLEFLIYQGAEVGWAAPTNESSVTAQDITDAIAAHEAELDPHPQYLTQAEADLLYDPLGGGGGVTDHGLLTGLADDDHPQYALDTDLTTEAADRAAADAALDGRLDTEEAATIAHDGRLDVLEAVYAAITVRSHAGAADSVAASTDVTLTADTSDEAGGVAYSAGTYTPAAGRWKITATASFQANANGFRQIDAYFNGTTSYVLSKVANNTNGANVTTIGGSRSIRFNGSQTVVIRARHNSTTTPLTVTLNEVIFEYLGA